MNGCDLEYLLDDTVKIWAFGHTHYTSDQVIRNTRVVSNQCRYPRENYDYILKKVVYKDKAFQENLVIDTEEPLANIEKAAKGIYE